MMGLVGRDPYFEVNNNQLNTQAIDQMGIEMAQLRGALGAYRYPFAG
jgi:hypothetical protein